MGDWPYILHRLGVSYYTTGTIDRAGAKLFDFYKVDKLRPAQRRAIQRLQGDVKFMGSRSEYAPELTSALVCIPKAAFYRQNSKA